MTDFTDLISQWLAAYQRSDHAAMAACYHEQATFEDIAFQLSGKKQIQAMWHMICDNGITVVEDSPPHVDGDCVVLRITDHYTFSSTGRPVKNPITCRFRFRDGLIVEHCDECDPKSWAQKAMGGMKGWLAGRISYLRRSAARKKLAAFISKHPEYSPTK